jgi:hypothetical protein
MDKRELQTLSNVLNNDYGFQFILLLLNELGAFDRGINRNASDKEIFMTLGKREKGQWLLDCVFKANKQKYLDLIEQKEKEHE